MTTTPTPYAHILHAIADDKTVQWQDSVGNWIDQPNRRTLQEIAMEHHHPERYRVKPRTITINGHEVPEPTRAAPEPDEPFWLPAILMSAEDENTSARRWTGTHGCYRWLQQGLVHLTKEAASAHAAAASTA
jgi:hypothetical protein